MIADCRTWTPDEIRDYFDQNPGLLLHEYAVMLGITVDELKDILMGD